MVGGLLSSIEFSEKEPPVLITTSVMLCYVILSPVYIGYNDRYTIIQPTSLNHYDIAFLSVRVILMLWEPEGPIGITKCEEKYFELHPLCGSPNGPLSIIHSVKIDLSAEAWMD